MRRGLDLIPDEKNFSGQFVVRYGQSDKRSLLRKEIRIGDCSVYLCESTTYVDVYLGETAERVGVLIGDPLGDVIEEDGNRVRVPIDGGVDEQSAFSCIEQTMYSLCGAWVLVASFGSVCRVYVDAAASKPLVFDPLLKRAASTAGLLLSDEEYCDRFDAELYAHLDVKNVGWFPSGLTAHHGIRRLLANHFLDMRSMESRRHWPKSEIQCVTDTESSCRRFISLTRRHLSLLGNQESTVCTLTGGNESRFILAAAHNDIDRREFVTLALPGARKDLVVAKRLAQSFGLRHSVIPSVAASKRQQVSWQYSSGHCVGGMNQIYHPTLRGISGKDYLIGGVGGEVARAFFWRPTDTVDCRLDARAIIRRMGLPAHQRVLQSTEEWLQTVSRFDALTILDLAFIELRISPWSFTHSYSQDSIIKHFQPLVSRESFELMLSLPPSFKRQSALFSSAVRLVCPELLEIPINRFGDFRDGLDLMGKLLQPKRVLRRIRKKLR